MNFSAKATQTYNAVPVMIIIKQGRDQSWTGATKLRFPKHSNTDRCIGSQVPESRKRAGLFIDETDMGEGRYRDLSYTIGGKN